MRRRLSIALLLGTLTLTAPQSPAAPTPATGVRCETWSVPPDGQLTDTLADGSLDHSTPQTTTLPAFELSPAPAEPDVIVLRGYVRPPASGDYTFRIAGDDTALLYLSTDDRPANRRVIATVPSYTDPRDFAHYAAQTSRLIHLLAGHRYYAEAWLQNAEGNSHVTVGWTRPDGTAEAPIPGEDLTPATSRVVPPSYRVGPATVTLKPDPQPIDMPGFHRLIAGAHVKTTVDEFDLSYLVYVPERFDHTADHRPLLVFLHGNGHQGTDLEGALNEGPANYLRDDDKLRAAFPMIGLFPQLPEGYRWDSPGAAQAVNALVREVLHRYRRIDPRRIYLTGLSMGGKGSWLTALDSPATYAAVATMSAVAVHPNVAGRILAGIPHIHLVCGGDDGEFAAGSQAMYDALKPSLGKRVDLTVIPHEGHGVWGRYYPDPAFYKDLMSYSR